MATRSGTYLDKASSNRGFATVPANSRCLGLSNDAASVSALLGVETGQVGSSSFLCWSGKGGSGSKSEVGDSVGELHGGDVEQRKRSNVMYYSKYGEML